MRRRVAFSLAVLAAGCGGLGGVRASQDWSGVTDVRLLRTCHVTGYGSGVWLRHGAEESFVLTVAHLVEDAEAVAVWLRDPARGRYERFKGIVVRRSHPHKEDLCLLRLDPPPAWAEPFDVTVDAPFAVGEERPCELMNVAFGAESAPFVLPAPVLAFDTRVTSYVADAEGKKEWLLTKGLLHGGVLQANSGSPVYRGNALVGLVESAPAIGMRPRPGAPGTRDAVQGVQVSLPQSLASFLAE